MPEIGFFELYPSIRPALPAGSYVLGADHDLTAAPLNNGPGDLAVDGTDFTLKILAPRYTMPPNQILSTFPPASAVGDWRQRLPQIVFKRRTLPWERDPDTVAPRFTVAENHPPYLALVVLAEGEATVSGDVDVTKCVTPGTPMADDADTSTGKYLEVRQSIVDKIFPTVADLQLLAHVRKVNLEDTELALGDDDGYLSVVVSNRLPQPGPRDADGNITSVRYTAYLVNVEGQLHNLPATEQTEIELQFVAFMPELQVAEFLSLAPNMTADVITMKGASLNSLIPKAAGAGAAAEVAVQRSTSKGMELAAASYVAGPAKQIASSANDNVAANEWISGQLVTGVFDIGYIYLEPTYRFPVLTSWEFVCTGDGTFETIMGALDSGMLGTEDPRLDPALQADVTDTGHISLDHTTRRGEPVRAWYRGPFVPQPTLRTKPNPDGSVPLAHTGDQLRRVVPDGHEDLSQASAFEIGRLLALSKPGVVAALSRWRQELFGAARLQQLGLNFMDELVAGFSSAAIAEHGMLDALIADHIVNHYTGGVIKQMPTANSFAASRTPDIVAKTKPEQVLNGLGLDAQAVRTAVSDGGLAALAGLEVRSAEMSREPLSGTKDDLAIVQSALTLHIENVALQALGKQPGAPVDHNVGARPRKKGPAKAGAPKAAPAAPSTRRRKDDLDKLIDRAVAARRSDKGAPR